ncbi:hypothetical protein GCM10009020_32260 [Natronoarchaeum mannanilyticum]|uniref:Small CPxCG-related zinc finger protein n=1 Tax=Natronoarchaeum mannanilyticum TaxID=926360 RepID=A0AAV3TE47_9EURY
MIPALASRKRRLRPLSERNTKAYDGSGGEQSQMPLLDHVRSLLDGSGETVYECRVCGTNTPADAERCTECGSSEITAFDI